MILVLQIRIIINLSLVSSLVGWWVSQLDKEIWIRINDFLLNIYDRILQTVLNKDFLLIGEGGISIGHLEKTIFAVEINFINYRGLTLLNFKI